MLRTISLPNSAAEAEVKKNVELAQLTYAAAMLDMKNIYIEIRDEKTYFGFTEDYIPFPALYKLDSNGFSKLLEIARRKVQIAQEKENRALDDNRSFETDSASFQSELAQIKREYDNQLADICGTFIGDDGLVYPAIQKYAQYSSEVIQLGDPCGLVGTGEISEMLINSEISQKDIDLIKGRLNNALLDVEDEKRKVVDQCARIQSLEDFRLEKENKIISVNKQVSDARNTISILDRSMQSAQTMAQFVKCSIIVGLAGGGDCPLSGVAAGIYAAATAVTTGVAIGIEQDIADKEKLVNELQRDLVIRDIEEQCTSLQIDTRYMVNDLLRRVVEINLEGQRKVVEAKLNVVTLEKLRNKAKMIEKQLGESEELAISVQAAKNDPNVRIYRNDAIIAADRTFYDALSSVYRLTKVYEYYTAQSYPDKIKLPLVRMISYGTYSLESYMADLEETFYQFEEVYGIPDKRVLHISAKDDIFKITYVDENGEELSKSEQDNLFHQKLADPNLLDGNGYIVIPFSTSLKRLSPLTHNHKIQSISVNLSASGVDGFERVYLRQLGTGVIKTADQEKILVSLPKRTAVVNTYNSSKKSELDPDIYVNERLRDRPLVNTSWELILNLKDEEDNLDIQIENVTDIHLYITYEDFTQY
jgi:hypothetical protein